MKLSVAIQTPESDLRVPVALLSGTFEERLRKAARMGYDGVELMACAPRELDADRVRAQVRSAGLEVSAVGSGAVFVTEKVSLLAKDAAVAQRARVRLSELIELAARLAAGCLTIGSFRGKLEWAGMDGRERLVEILGQAAVEAARAGVRLVLEPLNRYESDIINNAEEGLALVREVDQSSLGIVIDTYHMNIEEKSLPTCLRTVMTAGRLWHIHLGDSNRHPPGRGHIDFAEIVATLRECGYSEYLSAELLPVPDEDRAAEETLTYMRKMIGE